MLVAALAARLASGEESAAAAITRVAGGGNASPKAAYVSRSLLTPEVSPASCFYVGERKRRRGHRHRDSGGAKAAMLVKRSPATFCAHLSNIMARNLSSLRNS